MNAHRKLGLSTYMGRQNYLRSFNSFESINQELDYIESRLRNKNLDLLTRAVLELKQIDLLDKLKTFDSYMGNHFTVALPFLNLRK